MPGEYGYETSAGAAARITGARTALDDILRGATAPRPVSPLSPASSSPPDTEFERAWEEGRLGPSDPVYLWPDPVDEARKEEDKKRRATERLQAARDSLARTLQEVPADAPPRYIDAATNLVEALNRNAIWDSPSSRLHFLATSMHAARQLMRAGSATTGFKKRKRGRGKSAKTGERQD